MPPDEVAFEVAQDIPALDMASARNPMREFAALNLSSVNRPVTPVLIGDAAEIGLQAGSGVGAAPGVGQIHEADRGEWWHRRS